MKQVGLKTTVPQSLSAQPTPKGCYVNKMGGVYPALSSLEERKGRIKYVDRPEGGETAARHLSILE